MSDEIRWSNSALMTLEVCGEKFRRRYLERQFVPGTLSLKRGSAIHAVAREAHKRQKAALDTIEEWRTPAGALGALLNAAGAPPTPVQKAITAAQHEARAALPSIKEAKEMAAAAFEQEVLNGYTISNEEHTIGAGKVEAQAKDLAVGLSALYVKEAAPKVLPLHVERHIVIQPTPGGLDFAIHGTMDLLGHYFAPFEIGGPMRLEEIRDVKSSVRSPPATAAHTSQQLTLYALLRMAETRRLPDRVALDYLVQTPTGKRSVVARQSQRNMEEMRGMTLRLNRAVEAVKKGVFVPADPSSWQCSERWCEYFHDCPFASKQMQREEE